MSATLQRSPTSERDATLPSPFGGEGAEPARGEAGEGTTNHESPSPGASHALGLSRDLEGVSERLAGAMQ